MFAKWQRILASSRAQISWYRFSLVALFSKGGSAKLIIKGMIASLSSGVKFNILLDPDRIWWKSLLEQVAFGDCLNLVGIGKIFWFRCSMELLGLWWSDFKTISSFEKLNSCRFQICIQIFSTFTNKFAPDEVLHRARFAEIDKRHN